MKAAASLLLIALTMIGCSTIRSGINPLTGTYRYMHPEIAISSTLTIKNDSTFYYEQLNQEGGQLYSVIVSGTWKYLNGKFYLDSNMDAPYPHELKIGYKCVYYKDDDGIKIEFKKSANQAVDAMQTKARSFDRTASDINDLRPGRQSEVGIASL